MYSISFDARSLIYPLLQENRAIRHALKMRTYGYEREYAANEEKLVNLRREAKLNSGFYKEDDAKVIFAMRLKG